MKRLVWSLAIECILVTKHFPYNQYSQKPDTAKHMTKYIHADAKQPNLGSSQFQQKLVISKGRICISSRRNLPHTEENDSNIITSTCMFTAGVGRHIRKVCGLLFKPREKTFSSHQWLGKVLSLISVRASWSASVVTECRLFCEAWIAVNLQLLQHKSSALVYKWWGWGCRTMSMSEHWDISTFLLRPLLPVTQGIVGDPLLLLLQGGKMRSLLRSKGKELKGKQQCLLDVQTLSSVPCFEHCQNSFLMWPWASYLPLFPRFHAYCVKSMC